jgi:spore coat polysaccharide biosynthesis protein SpsF (cytidylyltransferase family)
MKTGVVICSRSDSKRVPNKPFIQVNGCPILEHLIRRLLPLNCPIYLAVPHFDFEIYRTFAQRFSKRDVIVIAGSASDPLRRMAKVCEQYELEAAIRICHDKIFVDPKTISECLEIFHTSGLDYLYSSKFVDGSGFEIISNQAIQKAAKIFKDIEHISYAIHCVTEKSCNVPIDQHLKNHRLLIDYPEDLKVIEILLTTLGNECTLEDAIHFLEKNEWVTRINSLPLLSIYTCAYNAENWIQQAMGSVSMQEGFKDFEYLLIDDFSSDKTTFFMSQFCSIYKNSKWIRNTSNLGLASSSNIALSQARGKYILRLDADDYLSQRKSLRFLLDAIEGSSQDIIYPDNYCGSYKKIQKGNEHHHVGGAIFRTRAANHVKFTEGLRGYEGYDFFERAKDQLKIGYLERPVFFYRRHPNSMSSEDQQKREEIKRMIDEKNATQRHRAYVPQV